MKRQVVRMLMLVMELESLVAVQVKEDQPAEWILLQPLLDIESVYVSLHHSGDTHVPPWDAHLS